MNFNKPSLATGEDKTGRMKVMHQYVIQKLHSLIHEKIIHELIRTPLHCSQCGTQNVPQDVSINSNGESATFFCGNSECQSLNVVEFNLGAREIDDTVRAALTIHPAQLAEEKTELQIIQEITEELVNSGIINKIVGGVIERKSEREFVDRETTILPELKVDEMSSAEFSVLADTLVELYTKTIRSVPSLIHKGKIEEAQKILDYLITVIGKITGKIGRAGNKKELVAEFVKLVEQRESQLDMIEMIMDLTKFSSVLESALTNAKQNIDMSHPDYRKSPEYAIIQTFETQIAGLRDMTTAFVKNFSTSR